jgi:hypothetical protein
MVDFSFGTPLVHLDTRKMKKLSHKDVIIALGVLVAAIIVITTVFFKDAAAANNSVKVVPERKIKPAAILKTVVQKFSSRSSI